MKTAMILAAGRGERLMPLTNSTPKALCAVNGVPLIEHHVINLSRAGFTRLVINHAWLGGQIRRHLGDGRKWGVELCYTPEPPGGLETGGGIFNALPLLGDEPFLTVNADIYTDFKFNDLHLPDGSLAHWFLGQNPEHNPHGDFGLGHNQKLSTVGPLYTFLGIAIYHPKTFLSYSLGRYSVVPMLRKLIETQQASGELLDGFWLDIGTAERLRYANDLLKGEKGCRI